MAGVRSGFGRRFDALPGASLLVLVGILVAVTVIGGLLVPQIFQAMNLANIMRMTAIVGLVALGQTLVMITGEIDLSLGSIMSLSLVVGTLGFDGGSGTALLLTAMAGLLLGLVNGAVVAFGRVSSLIVTLGTMSIFAGLANLVTRGQAKYLYGMDAYLWIGKGDVLGLPVPALILLIAVAITSIILSFSNAGKALYFVGASERAAWYSGLSARRAKLAVFGAAGFLAALAGPMLASQTNRVTPIQGAGFELSAIAIAVLGGTALDGARGSPMGTLIGTMIFGVLLNILALSGVGTYVEQTLKGALLIGIVILFQIRRKR